MKLLIAALLIAVAATPAPEPRYFQYQRSIQLAPNTAGQACFVLDTQTFSHAASGLSDLRVYRGTDETPYVIRYARPSLQPQPTIAPINQGRREGKTVFDAAMPEGEYSDLQLNLTGQNFLATVTVSGSHTVAGPATRIGAYTIFDFSNEHLGRSTALHLPRSNFRYLHFEIAGPIAPDQIMNIVAAPIPASEPKYFTILKGLQFTQKGHTSVAEFDLPANVPVDRIVFAPAAQPVNFSRALEVQALEITPSKEEGNPPPASRFVASGYLLRIHHVQEGHHIDEEHLVLDANQSTFSLPTKWTVTIQNGDDVPVQLVDAQVQMLERNLCFEAAAGNSYTLYYGDAALFAPRYDYAAWFALQTNAVNASLAPDQANPAFQTRPDTRPFSEKHPALLWIMLVVVVLLLGIVALRSARRVNPSPPMP